MPETMQRPLSPAERLRKASELLQQGTEEFRIAEAADSELSIRRRAALACETAFHSLIELADALIQQSNRPIPESHDDRVEALEDLGRQDLAHLYSGAFQALHISGYYSQRVGRLQQDCMREVARVVEHELQKFA